MADGKCPKCGNVKENPNSSYCKKCAAEYTHNRRQQNLEHARKVDRDRIANMTPEEKRAYLDKKQAGQRAWLAANPEVRARRNAEARAMAKTWGPEKKARVKEIQLAHYARRMERTALGLCAYSTNCNQPPLGAQKFCLEHWCQGLRTADMRQKSDYSVQDLMTLWMRQGGKCSITGVLLIAGETAALDHILPVARGGVSTIDNLRFIHTGVNRMKWDSTDEEFRSLVLEIGPDLVRWALDKSSMPV